MFKTLFSERHTPFHAGEIDVQNKLGVRDHAEALGQSMILNHVPDAHNHFYQQLPLVFIGVQDSHQRPWATVVFGQPGFVQAPKPAELTINAVPHGQDRVAGYLSPGKAVGMLGIDFKLRRRSRLNGVVRYSVEGNTLLDVQQCFVNCPKYIQARTLRSATLNPLEPHQIASGVHLSEAQINLVHHADTFFIASQHKAEQGSDNRNGIDLSHRGGKSGFAKASDDGSVITWPDFAGNNMFNTLGNISRDPRAGLLFVDYQRGDILSLTGEADIVWEGSEVEAFAGSERNVRLRITRWTHLINAYTFDWSEPELSPFLRSTGNW